MKNFNLNERISSSEYNNFYRLNVITCIVIFIIYFLIVRFLNIYVYYHVLNPQSNDKSYFLLFLE